MLTGLLLLVALLVAACGWWLLRRLQRAERQLRELGTLGRELTAVREDMALQLGVTRAHLAAVAAGEAPARTTILRGAPAEDIEPADALALYERTPGLFVLDVRSPAEYRSGHIPNAHLVPLDELEDRLSELPGRDALVLVHCAAGGRSAAACEVLGRHGFTRLRNLAGGMHTWPGPRAKDEPVAAPDTDGAPTGITIAYRGGPVTGEQVVAAMRECYDPEIPLNICDLGLIYGVDIDESAIAVRMTLTSEGCPSARAIPEEVKRRVAALGQSNVTVDVVWDPPWHPTRISAQGKQKLGLA